MKALTDRQLEVLECITRSVDTRGYPPTIRELAAELRCTSLNTVWGHLLALERKGFIRRAPGARTITVLRRTA